MDASIRSFAGSELTLHDPLTDDFYELRYGDAVVARIGDPRNNGLTEAVTRDGRWTFRRLRGGSSDVSIGSFVVARYRSGIWLGGRIEIGEDVRLRLGRRSGRWRVTRGRRDVQLTIDPLHSPSRVLFGNSARGLHDLPLVTALAIHAMLVESSVTSGGSNGPGM